MESISIPEDVPADLKSLKELLKRAHELKSVDPVMCYWCCYRAAEVAVAEKSSKEGTALLMSLLDALEKMKSILLPTPNGEAVSSDLVGQSHVENFALKVFMGADNEERECRATKATIRKFVAAMSFLEVLKSFGELDPDIEAKLKYAKFKAASLAKAIREGTLPPPAAAPQPTHDTTDVEEQLDLKKTESDRWSNVATPGAVDDDRFLMLGAVDTPKETPHPTPSSFVQRPSTSGSENVEDINFPSTPSKVRFAGVEDVPDEDIPQTAQPPPPPAFINKPSTPSSNPSLPPISPPSNDSPGIKVQLNPPPPTTLPLPPTAPVFPVPTPSSSPPIPQIQSSLPSSTKAPSAPVLTSKPQQKVPPPSVAPSTVTRQPLVPPPPTVKKEKDEISLEMIEKVQKHAKWAISALNYEDVDTARSELKKALEMLG